MIKPFLFFKGEAIGKKILIIVLIFSMIMSQLSTFSLVIYAVSDDILASDDVLEIDRGESLPDDGMDVDKEDVSDDSSIDDDFVVETELIDEIDNEELVLQEDVEANQELIVESVDSCNVITEGQFDNGEGIEGAPWVLCDDGVLTVDEGFIQMPEESLRSPWDAHADYITRIIFTGPITAGSNLSHLFVRLWNVYEIEGLAYFDTSNVTDMSWMFSQSFMTWGLPSMRNVFSRPSNLESLDLSAWDTSNVTEMQGMFSWSNISNLDVSTWDISNVTDMSWIFWGATYLTSLDLSTWDTNNVVMDSMFRTVTSLRELTLGSEFNFLLNEDVLLCIEVCVYDAGLPEIEQTDEFTGYWQSVGDGTIEAPTGEFVFTSTELMEQYDGSIMADIFVWQPVREEPLPTHDITQLAIGGIAGVIDQDAHTITFTVPANMIDHHSQFRGEITELTATIDTIIFYVGGQDWQLGLGDVVGVSTGDTVRVEGGIRYKFVVEPDGEGDNTRPPGPPEEEIDSISIEAMRAFLEANTPTNRIIIPATAITEVQIIGAVERALNEVEGIDAAIIVNLIRQTDTVITDNRIEHVTVELNINPTYEFEDITIYFGYASDDSNNDNNNNINNGSENEGSTPTRPSLPQTGMIARSTLLGGSILGVIGLTIASKKKNK